MRSLTLAWACRVLFLFTMAHSAASTAAAPPALASVNGQWKKSSTSEQEAQRARVIQDATADFNVYIRGIARGRLEKRTTAPEFLSVDVDEHHISLRYAGGHWKIPLNGKAQNMALSDGTGTVSAVVDRGSVVIVAVGENGRRTTTYTPSTDGRTMLWTVSITSERLSKPVMASATFRRLKREQGRESATK